MPKKKEPLVSEIAADIIKTGDDIRAERLAKTEAQKAERAERQAQYEAERQERRETAKAENAQATVDTRERLVEHFKGLADGLPEDSPVLADIRSKVSDDEYAAIVG